MNSLKNVFHVIFCSIILALGVSGASFRIHSLEIFTSDCHDCGVGVLGEVSVKAGSERVNHLFGNDFKPGESNHFEGSFLGECDGFDLGESNTINLNNVIEIYHDGMDGGKFDWVKLRTSYVNDLIQCNFYRFLDDNDHEIGSDCTIAG